MGFITLVRQTCNMAKNARELVVLVQDLLHAYDSTPNSNYISTLVEEVRKYISKNEEMPKNEMHEILNYLDAIKRKTISETERYEIERIENEIQRRFQVNNKTTTRSPDRLIPSLETSERDSVVFLLGAGASAASDIPLVRELLEKLVEQARRTQDDDFNQLMEECRRRSDINIEDLLTAVYLSEFAVSEPSTLDLLQYFLLNDGKSPLTGSEMSDGQVETDVTSVNFIQDTIQTLFGSIASEMIPKDPNETHTEIRRFVEDHENVSIITTNYDYCMDEELFKSINVNTGLDLVDNENEPEGSVNLYKLHGSINWTYCDTCQSIDGVRPEKVKNKFNPDSGTLDYPVIGICPVCKGQRRPLLVPPTSFKFVQFTPLINIRKGAMDELNEADYIIPVGYSFSDADAYVYKLVWGAMRRSDDTNMIVVDPSAEEENGVATELRERFEAQVEEFDGEERIKSVAGRSEEVMGDLVDELLNYGDQDTGEADSDEGGT